MTLEQKTADTILQNAKKINIGGIDYDVAPATTATLIEVSALISKLPDIELHKDNYIYESLMIAKDCKIIGLIAATLVLGVSKQHFIPYRNKNRLNWLKINNKERKYEELADLILNNYSPSKLNSLIVDLLTPLGLKDFFEVTTSLLEVNLLRKTRAVVKTTVSGQ